MYVYHINKLISGVFVAKELMGQQGKDDESLFYLWNVSVYVSKKHKTTNDANILFWYLFVVV